MSITTQNWDGVTAPSATITGWTVGSGFATSTAQAVSSPNSLAASASGYSFATWSSLDGNGGNVQASASFYFGTAYGLGTAPAFGVAIRGSADPLNATSTTQYAAVIEANDYSSGAWSLVLYKVVAGTWTALATLSGPTTTNVSGAWFNLAVNANGSTLEVIVTRASDGYYLNASGVFGTPVVTCLSKTDSSISGAGYSGVFVQGGSSANVVYTDNFALDATAAPVSVTTTATAFSASSSLPIELVGALGNLFYDHGKMNTWNGTINLAGDPIYVALVSDAYSPNRVTDQYWSDVLAYEVTGAGYTAGGQALTGQAVTADTVNHRALFAANNPTWNPATFVARAAVLYKNTGTPSTSPVIGYSDFGGNKPCSASPFTIAWDATNGIARF